MGNSTATVAFVSADDAQKYYDDAVNGIVYSNEGGREKFVLVELSKDVEPVSGMLREILEQGATRCLVAFGNEVNLDIVEMSKRPALQRLKMEHVIDEISLEGVCLTPVSARLIS